MEGVSVERGQKYLVILEKKKWRWVWNYQELHWSTQIVINIFDQLNVAYNWMSRGTHLCLCRSSGIWVTQISVIK